MTNLLLQIGGTKLIFSIILACGVWVVHRRVGRCAVSYPLWLLVLVALLAPAVVSLPVFPAVGSGAAGSSGMSPGAVGALLVLLWVVGTAVLLGWTLLRAFRFQRTLRRAAQLAPAELQHQAAEIGHNLGMARVPEIHTTSARVSPMVWWTGGKVRVLVPRFPARSARPERPASDPRPRTRARAPPGLPGPMAGVAGLFGLLVEPGGLVGPPPAPRRRGVVLRRAGSGRAEVQPPELRQVAAASDRTDVGVEDHPRPRVCERR